MARITEGDVDLSGKCEALMVDELFPVPGQRPVKLVSRCDYLMSAETTLSVSLFATLTSIT